MKFCIVGLSGTAIGVVSLWFITEIVGVFYLISAVFATELAISNNFVWNEFWTFRDRVNKFLADGVLRRWFKFNLARAGGAVIALTTLALLTEVIGIYYLVSNIFAIGAATLFNYLTSATWVWGE